MDIEIELNGAPHAIADGRSVQDLVAALGLAGKGIAVAVNRQVIPRDTWPAHLLRPCDRVELVRAIGGG
ncbi:MAG: thiS [Herminiimonas sp.]|jgi:sulfur carrier protein|nr:thiS [Herminiimonas sp.]